MKLIIHRGTHEIGGTCVELMTGKSRILIDFGMPLVDSRQEPFDSKILAAKSIAELKQLGILPGIKGLYKGEERSVDAVLISHSHMDHYGLLGYVHPDIPLFMSEGAKALIEISELFIPHKVGKLNARVFGKDKPVPAGGFSITPYLVDHSAFDALAFLIEAGGKRLFYSGDFRSHGRKSGLFDRILADPPPNIDCLLMEGAMLGRGKQIYKNETAVEAGIEEVLRSNGNMTFLFVSSQNIDRLVSAYRACLKTNSIFVIDLYTAFILHKLGNVSARIPQFDWKNIRVKFLISHAGRLADSGHKELLYLFNKKKIKMEEINANKGKILMLVRHNSTFPKVVKKIPGIKGAKIIYSMWEGYLKPDFEEYCRDQGMEIRQIHTSGHATVEDLQAFAKAVNPRVLIPIHTFAPDKYRQLFKGVRVLEDKEMFDLDGE